MENINQPHLAEKQFPSQLIIFRAGKEEFGVSIEEVREIIKLTAPTSIPNAPNFVQGVINVRGEIVTIIDLKTRFSIPSEPNVVPKHIVVSKQEENLFGLLVDEVIEVLRIGKDEIKPPPSIIKKIHKRFLKGIISNNNRLIIILDLNTVLSIEENNLNSENKLNKKSKTNASNLHNKLVDEDASTNVSDSSNKPKDK